MDGDPPAEIAGTGHGYRFVRPGVDGAGGMGTAGPA